MTEAQDDVIGFLSSGAAYGQPGARIERIETHCSIVFLVGDRAYKLKRAVAFSALDYTTIEKREAACRTELVLNRRTAPELYLGVHAVCRHEDGRLAIDGAGAALDWVVEMRRFDQADLFDHLAEARRLSADLIRALADEIAGFHAGAEITLQFGGADGLRAAIETNRRDQETVATILDLDLIAQLHAKSLASLAALSTLLDRRRQDGHVRRCHGDLRLANICLFGGRPRLFDAIEFDDRLSCIDVFYDLAFLLMDFGHRRLPGFANLVFNRYLDRTGDVGGLQALPLFLSVRAGTRAYSSAGAALRARKDDKAEELARVARSHLDQAFALLRPAPAFLVAIGGANVAVRSALAQELAGFFLLAPGARIVRARDGRPASADNDALATEAAQALATGYSVIIDAAFDKKAQREAVAALSRAAGVGFSGLWLGAGESAPWQRIDAAQDLAAMLTTARQAMPPGFSRSS